MKDWFVHQILRLRKDAAGLAHRDHFHFADLFILDLQPQSENHRMPMFFNGAAESHLPGGWVGEIQLVVSVSWTPEASNKIPIHPMARGIICQIVY
jgi:hypothetical protein